MLSFVAFVQLLVEIMDCAGGILGFQRTRLKNTVIMRRLRTPCQSCFQSYSSITIHVGECHKGGIPRAAERGESPIAPRFPSLGDIIK